MDRISQGVHPTAPKPSTVDTTGGVLIAGAWRSGRTTRAEAAARAAGSGALVFFVRGGRPLLAGLYEAACRIAGHDDVHGEITRAATVVSESIVTEARGLVSLRRAPRQRLDASLAALRVTAGRHGRAPLLVVDDLDGYPADDMALLGWLVRQLLGTGWSAVMTCRDDVVESGSAGSPVAALADDTMLVASTVAAMSQDAVARAVAALVGGVPDETLVREIGRLAAWRCGAVIDATCALHAANGITIVDGYAFLATGRRPASLPLTHPVIRKLQSLGWAALAACQSVAALGGAVPVGSDGMPDPGWVDRNTTPTGIERCVRDGVLHRVGHSLTLAFPLVGELALELAGPVRRTRLPGPPPAHPAAPSGSTPDRPDATRLWTVLETWAAARTPADAHTVLSRPGSGDPGSTPAGDPALHGAVRWRDVAVRMAGHRAVVRSTGIAADDMAAVATEIHATARARGSRAAGILAAALLPPEFSALVSTAILLGVGEVTAARNGVREAIRSGVASTTAREWARLDDLVTACLAPGHRASVTDDLAHVSLCQTLDVLATRATVAPAPEISAASVLADFHAGRWDRAMAGARLVESRWARGTAHIGPVLRAVAAEILRHRGATNHARAWLRNGHGLDLVPHLDGWTRAGLCVSGGDGTAAIRLLSIHDRVAARTGNIIGRELLLSRSIAIALDNADVPSARRTLSRLAAVREDHPGPVVDYEWFLARALVDRDAPAARAALDLGRAGDRPADVLRASLAVAACGVEVAPMLSTAHALAVRLGSVLWRAQVAALMRHHGIPVPRETRDEAGFTGSERFLADLVAQDQTNRVAAHVLRVSDKRIEAILRGIFERTGCRSRVELAGRYCQGTLPGLPSPAWSQPGSGR